MKITVKSDIRKTLGSLTSNIKKQVQYASAVALTRTAQSGQSRLKSELSSKLDRPTPFILNSTFTSPATKASLSSSFGIKDKASNGRAPDKYLNEHFEGGYRGAKPYERVLQGMGILPSGWKTTPGKGMILNTYGNPSRREITALIRGLSMGSAASTKNKKDGYFAIRPGTTGRLQPGIYARKTIAGKQKVVLMLLFVRTASYSKRFDIQRLGEEAIKREFNQQFFRAYQE